MLIAGCGNSPLPPHRLWSLWDMLARYALKYIELGTDIEKLRVIFENSFNTETRISAADRSDLHALLEALAGICSDLELEVASGIVRRAQGNLPATFREFDQLVDNIYEELKSRRFLLLSHERQRYYEWTDAVSEKVRLSFRESAAEIREAASCYALARYTAAVFHAMRAAEIGTRKFAEQLSVAVPETLDYADWQKLLNEIASKITAIGHGKRGAEREADQVFFSQAAAQLQYFKDGWRVRLAHGRASYNEHEAREVIDHVRAFFETLAERLKE